MAEKVPKTVGVSIHYWLVSTLQHPHLFPGNGWPLISAVCTS